MNSEKTGSSRNQSENSGIVENNLLKDYPDRNDKTGFTSFLGLFKSENALSISEEYLERFLNIKWTEAEQLYSSFIADKVLFENENYIGVVYLVNCLAGGFCETTHLAIFDTSGILQVNYQIGFNYVDLAGENKMTFEVYDQNKLKLTTETTELNDDQEMTFTKKEDQIISIEQYME